MRTTTRLLAGLALLAPAAAVRAAPVELPLVNPSFEAFFVGTGAYRTGDISGWAREGGTRNSVGIQSASPVVFTLATPEDPLPAPADGPQFAFINTPAEGGEVALYQPLGALRPYTRYTLTVAIGNRRDKSYPDKVLLELRNGDTPTSPVLASASNAGAPPDGGFADHSVSFSTGQYVIGNLLIVIRNQTGQQVAFDNVRLTMESARAATLEATPAP